EDAAIGAREQAIVHAELAADRVAAFRGFDGVDVADDVGNRDIGSGELLDVSIVAAPVFDWRPLSHFSNQIAASPANRTEWLVVDLAARDHRNGFIQECRQLPEDPALGLASQTQE